MSFKWSLLILTFFRCTLWNQLRWELGVESVGQSKTATGEKYFFESLCCAFDILGLEKFLHCHFASSSNYYRVVLCRLWDLRLIRKIFHIAIDGIKLLHDSCRTFLLSKNLFFLPWRPRLACIERTVMCSRLLVICVRYTTDLNRRSRVQNIKIIILKKFVFTKAIESENVYKCWRTKFLENVE